MNLPPLPEPEGFRLRYRSEPGMIGHYPWTYSDQRRRQPVRPEHEIQDLFTADQMRAYAEAAVLAERATQADALHVAYSQGVADGRDAERERCATLCETASYRERWMRAGTNGTAIEPCRFAAAIRELGQ